MAIFREVAKLTERWTDEEPGWALRLEDALEDMGTKKAELRLAQNYWDEQRAAFVMSWIELQERER
ncbi:MAG: hypothetical protein JSR78_04225 [Proteobacteria bacterium]|nr:hypothetical protein [Pseudomonadota bacterium]